MQSRTVRAGDRWHKYTSVAILISSSLLIRWYSILRTDIYRVVMPNQQLGPGLSSAYILHGSEYTFLHGPQITCFDFYPTSFPERISTSTQELWWLCCMYFPCSWMMCSSGVPARCQVHLNFRGYSAIDDETGDTHITHCSPNLTIPKTV